MTSYNLAPASVLPMLSAAGLAKPGILSLASSCGRKVLSPGPSREQGRDSYQLLLVPSAPYLLPFEGVIHPVKYPFCVVVQNWIALLDVYPHKVSLTSSFRIDCGKNSWSRTPPSRYAQQQHTMAYCPWKNSKLGWGYRALGH